MTCTAARRWQRTDQALPARWPARGRRTDRFPTAARRPPTATGSTCTWFSRWHASREDGRQPGAAATDTHWRIHYRIGMRKTRPFHHGRCRPGSAPAQLRSELSAQMSRPAPMAVGLSVRPAPPGLARRGDLRRRLSLVPPWLGRARPAGRVPSPPWPTPG